MNENQKVPKNLNTKWKEKPAAIHMPTKTIKNEN